MKTYKLPSRTTIKTRCGHLNNAFYQTAFPNVIPTDTEIEDTYNELEISENECVYCGRKFNKLNADHLHPILNRENNNLYLTDISNIVPCCADCNNKKGNLPFIDFYTDPKTKEYLFKCGLSEDEYNKRLKIISEYEKKSNYLVIDDECEYSRDKVLAIKNSFCDLLSKFSIWWGNEVRRKNGTPTLPVDESELLTQDDIDKLMEVGKILGYKIKKNKLNYKENATSLW